MFSLGRVVHCRARGSSWRGYAMVLQEPRNAVPNRNFPAKKSFQFNWYTKILQSAEQAPVLFLSRDAFTAERLKKLRLDLLKASEKVAPPKDSNTLPAPTFTVINGAIFGAALRNQPHINKDDAQRMIDGIQGGYAVLTLPAFHPPYLAAILRALEKSVPKRPTKSAEDKAKDEAAKTADPSTPGRRAKRPKTTPTPDLRVLGALIEGRIFMPDAMAHVSKLPTLDTLQAQIIGMLSAPSTQIAAVLSQASGGKLARTLEGLQKALEEKDA